MSLRDKLLAAPNYQSERVKWGEDEVEVRSLSARDRADFVALASGKEGDRGYMLREVQPVVVIRSTYDPETGELLFKPEDAEVLLTKSAATLDDVFKVAMRLSGMDKEALERAGNGSAPTRSGASATA